MKEVVDETEQSDIKLLEKGGGGTEAEADDTPVTQYMPQTHAYVQIYSYARMRIRTRTLNSHTHARTHTHACTHAHARVRACMHI